MWPGPLSGLFYVASAFWMGLFVYLLLGTALSWFIYLSGKLTGSMPNMRWVFTAVCLLAAGVAVFGSFRALSPALKPVDITLEGLPDSWSGKTIVQLSDIHLGAIRGPEFLEQIIQKVNSVRPELILITGDLFDGISGGALSDFTTPLNRLEAARGVFFVTGNHEGYLGLESPLAMLSKTNIQILENEVIDMDGLQIIGIPFPEHNRPNDVQSLLTDSAEYAAEKPSILLYHTPTSIHTHHADRDTQQTGTYWRPDTDMTAAESLGIDLQLSGHTHGGQLFPFTLITGLIFSGYDYGLHREGGLQIYITSGAGTWGPPMRVGCPPEIPVIRLRRAG
jgi:predicted MPP superfamily phosphohydrolase